jgi:site-specific recombinase XerC
MHQLNRDSIQIEADDIKEETGYDLNNDVHACGSGQVLGKGSKRRTFYVDEDSLILYSEYLETRTDQNPALFLSERKTRMSIRAIQYTLASWCKRLGAPHINVHRLRHSYATRLANANISTFILKDLMGHESSSTTQQYFKLTDQTLARGYFSAMEQFRK